MSTLDNITVDFTNHFCLPLPPVVGYDFLLYNDLQQLYCFIEFNDSTEKLHVNCCIAVNYMSYFSRCIIYMCYYIRICLSMLLSVCNCFSCLTQVNAFFMAAVIYTLVRKLQQTVLNERRKYRCVMIKMIIPKAEKKN